MSVCNIYFVSGSVCACSSCLFLYVFVVLGKLLGGHGPLAGSPVGRNRFLCWPRVPSLWLCRCGNYCQHPYSCPSLFPVSWGWRRWGLEFYIGSSCWFWPPCFFSCLFRWATSTDSRTYDEVPFEAIEVCGRRWTNIWSCAYTLTQWFPAFFSEDTFYKPYASQPSLQKKTLHKKALHFMCTDINAKHI